MAMTIKDQKVRTEYRQTEVGMIPGDWSVGLLGECLKSRPDYGINAPAVEFTDRLPAYIRITDITEDGRFSPENRVSVRGADTERYFLNEGELVFARTGASVGKSYLYNPNDGRLVFAGFLIRVRPDPRRLLPGFLAAYVRTGKFRAWVNLMSTRSGQPGINGNEYAQLPIPLPPVEEQRAIAWALADVDALIASLDKLIAKKRAIKTGTMQQVLTGRRRLHGFSGGWESGALGDGVSLLSGHHVLAQHCNARGEGTPYLTGPADFPEGKIQQTKFTDRPTTLCAPGDILVTVKGSGSGSLVIADAVYCISRQLMAIRVRKWDSRFIYYSLLQNASQFKAATTGLIPGLSRDDILEQILPLPPVPEQVAIAAVLTDMDAEITALEARRDKAQALKQGMMQQLLTGKIRLI